MIMQLVVGVLGTLLALLGCVSPEATRARGGGPGGDRGNRGEVIEMHAGSEPYHETPQLIGRVRPANDRQADRG